MRNTLESLHAFGVSPFTNEELGRFAQADDGDPGNRHDEDKSSASVPDVPPALVVVVGAGGGIRHDGRVLAAVVGDEGPGKEARDELAHT